MALCCTSRPRPAAWAAVKSEIASKETAAIRPGAERTWRPIPQPRGSTRTELRQDEAFLCQVSGLSDSPGLYSKS